MKTYVVRRIQVVTTTFTVKATSEGQAERLACEGKGKEIDHTNNVEYEVEEV